MPSKYCLCGYKVEPEWYYCPDCGDGLGFYAPHEPADYPDTPYGNLSRKTAKWAEKKMLEHAEPISVLERFGGKE